MKVLLTLLLVCTVALCSSQDLQAVKDTVFLKHTLGIRSEMTPFDTTIAERLIKKTDKCSCLVIDSLLNNKLDTVSYSEYQWGFGDYFKELVVTLSIQQNNCIDAILNNLNIRYKQRSFDLKTYNFEIHTVMNAILVSPENMVSIREYLLNTNYKFPKHLETNQNSSRLLKEFYRRLLKFQPEKLEDIPKERLDYLRSL